MIARNLHRQKLESPKASKLRPSEFRKVSVTKLAAVTFSDAEKPLRRYRRLKPWFDLANICWSVPFFSGDQLAHEEAFLAAARPFLDRARDTADFPADAMRASLREPLDSARLFELASVAHSDLMFCGCETWLTERQSREALGRISKIGRGVKFWLDRTAGRVGVTSFDPYRDYFLRALEGAETKRIRRCPICDKLFFALRLTQRACSKRCGGTLRVRAWRAHQGKYEQTRKEKPETVKSESKTRGAKPRQEHRK